MSQAVRLVVSVLTDLRRGTGAGRARAAGLLFALVLGLQFGCKGSGSTGGAAGSANGGAGSGASAASFSQIYAMIVPAMTAPRCVNCHGMPPSEISNGKLTIGVDQATAYAALVGKTSTSARCGGMTLVAPGHPEMSLLYLKLSQSPPPCGDRMPLGGSPLADTQLEMIRSWIAAGAKND